MRSWRKTLSKNDAWLWKLFIRKLKKKVGKKVLCVIQVVAGTTEWVEENHVNVYSSLRVEQRMGCGWHLLCFTYVCDFWVFCLSHQHGIRREREPADGEKNNENLNVFISFLGFVWFACWNIFHLSNRLMTVLDMKFLKGTCLLNFRKHHVAGGRAFLLSHNSTRIVTWKAWENYFKVKKKYHFKKERFLGKAFPVNMCKM